MNERYARLYTLPGNLHAGDAPVLIAAGALLKDNQDGRVLAQLKLQNLNQSQLTACKVSIRAFEPSGAELPGVESYSYLDLKVSCGENFGSKNPIYLPDNTTRTISVAVVQAVFENGEVWQHSGEEWAPVLQERQRLKEHFPDVELQKQYALEVGRNCEYVPTVAGSLFLCACGAVNLSSSETCSQCKRNIADLLSALDPAELTRKKDERLEQEEADRLEREQKIAETWKEARERREEKRRIVIAAVKKRRLHTAIIVGSIAVIIGIGIVLYLLRY